MKPQQTQEPHSENVGVKTNSAKRLWTFFGKVSKLKPEMRIAEAFSELHPNKSKNLLDIQSFIVVVASEITTFKEEMEDIGLSTHLDPTPYLKHEGVMRDFLQVLNFETSLNTKGRSFTPQVLDVLEICDEVLSRSKYSFTLQEQDLVLMRKQLLELKAQLQDLPEWVQKSLIKLINEIDAELSMVGIRGQKSYEAVQEKLLYYAATSSPKAYGVVDKLASILANMNLVKKLDGKSLKQLQLSNGTVDDNQT